MAKAGYRERQSTSLLRDTKISTRLTVLIAVSILGLFFFAINASVRFQEEARMADGRGPITKLAGAAALAGDAAGQAALERALAGRALAKEKGAAELLAAQGRRTDEAAAALRQ